MNQTRAVAADHQHGAFGDAVASTDQRIDGQFQVGIGHHHEVILRAAQRLHALAVTRRAASAT